MADDQLSLAIGKRGQNVSLAARLTGCRIDIKSETKVAEAELLQYASFDGTDAEESEEPNDDNIEVTEPELQNEAVEASAVTTDENSKE